MSKWKIIPGAEYHFITTTIVEWQSVFVAIPLFQTVIESLKYCIEYKGLHLHGYVIMQNHVHYIVSADPSKQISDIMRDFGRVTSHHITTMLEEMNRFEVLEIFDRAAREEGRGNRYKVWQGGFHPIAIDTEKFFRQKLDYMHDNPVRNGFVEKPEHWLYSSARNYLLEDHSIIGVECIE